MPVDMEQYREDPEYREYINYLNNTRQARIRADPAAYAAARAARQAQARQLIEFVAAHRAEGWTYRRITELAIKPIEEGGIGLYPPIGWEAVRIRYRRANGHPSTD